jgi:hypothetical protein
MVPPSMQRWLYPLVTVATGAILFLPGIGRFGLWDPHEVRVADLGRDVHDWSQAQHTFDITAGGKHPQRPPLTTWIMARSLGTLGISETGARLPFAGMAILGLVCVYFIGANLASRRAGLLAALVLGSAPGYILQARQVTSSVFLVAPTCAAVLGLILLLWPRSGRHTGQTIGVGAALTIIGLGLGTLAGGAMLGIVIPLGAAVLAGLLAWGLSVDAAPAGPDAGALCPAGVGPSFPAGSRAISGYAVQLAVIGGMLAIIAGFTIDHVFAASRYSPLVGATPAKAQSGVITWDYFLRQVGFSFFPMSALAPFAFGRLMFSSAIGRPAFARFLLTSWAVLAFFIGSLWVWRYGDLRFPALPALALGIGLLFDELLEAKETPEALFGFGVALCAAILARDLFLYPEYVATNHLLESVKWPAGANFAPVFVGFGLCFAAAAFVAFALRGRARLAGRIGIYALVGLALAHAVLMAFIVTPELSKHYSQKVLFDRFQKLRRSGEPLAQYRSPAKGLSYYAGGDIKDLASMPDLLTYLRGERRSFVIVPAEELGQLDQAARAASVPYYVVDDQSSRHLLVSNRLEAGERDRNRLRELVRQTPPSPQHAATAEFDGKIALIGYDLPPQISRGSNFVIKLHFQVKEKPPAGYRIFLHFDGPGTRFNGDHLPLDGKFPTELWSAGDYITDPHEMMAERATTPKGTFTVWMGFWPGGNGKRLKATTGPSDGQDRVRLGTVIVD